MPFSLKKKVAEACITTSLCYGSETWLPVNFKRLESLYGKLVRLLLGVRQSIPMDLCLFEASMPCIKEMILSRRKTFLEKALANNPNTPLGKAWTLISGLNSKAFQSFANSVEIVTDKTESLIRASDKSRFSTFLDLNPTLVHHPVYTSTVPDTLRLAITRLLLSSHNFKVETGRWTRPITPREARLCPICKTIEDEIHVILVCPKTLPVRTKYNFSATNFADFFTMDPLQCAKFTNDIMQMYD